MKAYRNCSADDLPALKRLWLACFDEKETAAELFFKRNKTTFHAYACDCGGAVVSALYLIDCTLNGAPAHYLCGASTLPQYRGRGIMSGLIAYALKDAEERGDRMSVLLPANEALYGFYGRLGYKTGCAVKTKRFSTDTCMAFKSGKPDLQELQKLCYKNKFLLWNNDYISFAAEYYGCYGAKTAEGKNTFAIYEADTESAEVIYAVYNDIEELKTLLRAEGIKEFGLSGSADSPLFAGKKAVPHGMIRPLGGRREENGKTEDVYIGITLQ